MYANAVINNMFAIKPVVIENKKGADAFLSTTNWCLDFYTFNSKKIPTEFSDFLNVVRDLENAKNQNSEMFLKLLKFNRMIEKGNGIRWIYYLGMVLLRLEDQPTYEKLLDWSWEYPKDIHNLHRLNHMYLPYSCTVPTQVNMVLDSARNSVWFIQSNGLLYNSDIISPKNNIRRRKTAHPKINTCIVSISPETKLYGDLVFKMFKNLLSNKKDDFNPMLIKYLAFEKGLWDTETVLIWNYIDSIFHSDQDILSLIISNDELNTEIATDLRNILQKRVNSTTFTTTSNFFSNKTRRLIKVLFNHHVNLTDNLFKGIHTDGSKFGSCADKNDEINMIYDVLRKTPSISSKLCCKTIQKIQKNMSDDDSIPNIKNDLLVKGFIKYIESLKSGKTVAKVRGVDLTSECYEYFKNETASESLEYKLAEMFKQLQNFIMPCFTEDFTYETFSKNVVLVLDRSGSMSGKPVETGCLYMLMMVKLFRVKTLYFFDSDIKIKTLTDTDIDGSFISLVKKIYVTTCGSTNLSSVFDELNKQNIMNKNILIITDGDCDPSSSTKPSSSPFHEATDINGKYKGLHTNFYLVVNVKVDKMAFPFLAIDPKVCYLTGNNPKTMRGFIKAMVMSMRNNVIVTPEMVMLYSIDYDELHLPCSVPSYSAILSEDHVRDLFEAFVKNMPPKKSCSESSESSSESSESSINSCDAIHFSE